MTRWRHAEELTMFNVWGCEANACSMCHPQTWMDYDVLFYRAQSHCNQFCQDKYLFLVRICAQSAFHARELHSSNEILSRLVSSIAQCQKQGTQLGKARPSQPVKSPIAAFNQSLALTLSPFFNGTHRTHNTLTIAGSFQVAWSRHAQEPFRIS